MGRLRALFGHRAPTRPQLVRAFVDGMVATHLSVPEVFESLTLAEGQPPHVARAECHALTVSLDICALWASVKSGDKALPILEAFQPAFLKALEPQVREAFQKIASVREEYYVKKIATLGDEKAAALEWRNLVRLMAATVTGHCRWEEQEARLDPLAALPSCGPLPNEPDIITIAMLAEFVSRYLETARKMYDDLQGKAPGLFCGPMT